MANPFIEDMLAKFKAGYPAMAVNSTEPSRCLFELRQAGWLMGQDRRVRLVSQDRTFFRDLFAQYPAYGYQASAAATAGAHLIKEAPPRRSGSQLEGSDLVVDVPSLLGLLGTFPEDTAESKTIRRVLDEAGYPLVTWGHHLNFDTLDGDFELDKALLTAAMTYDPSVTNPRDQLPRRCILAFLGGDEFLNHEGLNGMRFRAALEWVVDEERLCNKHIRRLLVFVQPQWPPQSRVGHCLHIVDFPPPSLEQLDAEVTFIETSLYSSRPDAVLKCPQELRSDVTAALRGFTRAEAVNAMSYCTVRHGGFVAEMLPTLHNLKAETLRRDAVLEYLDAQYIADSKDIGGYEVYQEYIARCKACYSQAARDAGIPRPKGILLLGLPGSGKSMVAMATAKMMRLPLIKYDFGAIFGGIVGESEATQRRVLARVKALGPAVLLIDEADKAFAGMSQTLGDSGVGQRVFGRLLSWMATENEETFIVMTMNRLAGVPIEMLRAGRLDATFYTTFPGPEERLDIVKIHMRQSRVDAERFDAAQWQELARLTEDFVGSELKQLVENAVRTSWTRESSTQPTFADLQLARQFVNPIVHLDKEGIEAIMRYCEGKATPVSRERRASGRPGYSGSGRRQGNIQLDP